MERHAVFFLMFNRTPEQLELTKQAFASILAQDIGFLDIFIVNNGSTQPTKDWLDSLEPAQDNGHWLYIRHSTFNVSPIKLANDYCDTIFRKHDKILGVPNDVILPPNLYRELASWPRGIVAAWMNGNLLAVEKCEKSKVVHEDVHMAVCMTRKWCYDALMAKDGYFFDEGMFMYASDCDFKLRLAACGIHGAQLDIQAYHYGSACWRLSTPDVSREINQQADRDRSYFERKWGHSVSDQWCGEAVRDINFRG